jgi:hypothetical protein
MDNCLPFAWHISLWHICDRSTDVEGHTAACIYHFSSREIRFKAVNNFIIDKGHIINNGNRYGKILQQRQKVWVDKGRWRTGDSVHSSGVESGIQIHEGDKVTFEIAGGRRGPKGREGGKSITYWGFIHNILKEDRHFPRCISCSKLSFKSSCDTWMSKIHFSSRKCSSP